MSKKRLLSRAEVDVDVWEERDRLSIVIKDKKTGQQTIAEWWDDDARQMFEDGFFKRGGELKRSVIAYAEEMGLLAKQGPGSMTLAQWAWNQPYQLQKSAKTCSIPDGKLVNRSAAWHLSDYIVSSVSGGSIWFAPRSEGVRQNIFTFNNPGNAQRVLAENFVKGANSGVASSMYIHGNRIYSYGPHFPIAERHTISTTPLAGTPVIIITARKSPSKTTSGQIGLVKAAAQQAGMEIMYEELKPEAKGPAAYSNPGKVRENIFTFNNPRKLNEMESTAAAVGLVIGTWAPGDGLTRYRFFLSDGKSSYGDYHQGDGLYTALGRKDAMAFISAYGKGRSARKNPRGGGAPLYVIEGFTPFARRGQGGRRIGAFKTGSLEEARARAEQIFKETGVVVAITQKNPLTRSEAGYLLRHAKADVHAAGFSRRHGFASEQKYHTGRARGIGFAVQETGPKSAQKAWVEIHTRLDRTIRNPVCSNPVIRGDKLPYNLQQEVLRKFIYRWTSDNTQREYAWRGISGKPRIPLITDAQWLREHAFHVTKAGRLSLTHHHAEPHYMADDWKKNPLTRAETIELEHEARGERIIGEQVQSPGSRGYAIGRSEGMRHVIKKYGSYARSNPLLQTVMLANPPISAQWDSLTGRQRYQILGFVGFEETASRYVRLPWKLLSDMVKQALEQYWSDSSSGRGTTRRYPARVANPLNRREAAGVLREAKRDIRYGSGFRSGDFTRTVSAGQAFGKSKVVRKYGPKSAGRAAAKIADKTHKMVGTIFSNPGLRLPAPGTKMTVAQAMELARRIGDKDLIKQCKEAAALQTKANSGAKSVTWKHLPMGSKDKIDSVVALAHYGESPEDMYRPPKGSKKGAHMYRHKWGEGTGRSKPVQVLASPSGKMIVKVMGPGQKVGDWMRG